MSEKDKQDIVMKYKYSLVENYYHYLEVIDELNAQIPQFTKDINKSENFDYINIKDIEPFTYPSFCRSFLNNLRIELKEEVNFTKTTINNIFMVMVEDKILESSASSSGESEILGNEYES